MSKLDKLGKFDFMPNPEETTRNNQNLSEMFRGGVTDYDYLPLSSISFNPNNDYAENDPEETIKNLAEDIRRNGLLHNIVVSRVAPGQYKLLSGERRLRAYQHLAETTKEASYQSIYALIKKNLTPRQEMIILDAANLQTRGSMTDEKKFRKAGLRFIENLKEEFNISDREAVTLTKEFSDVQERTIDRNLSIERDLNKKLLALLDDGEISKNDALLFVSVSPSFQKKIADILICAKKTGNRVAFSQICQMLSEHTRREKTLREALEAREDSLRSVRQEIVRCPIDQVKLLRRQEQEIVEQIENTKKELGTNLSSMDALYLRNRRTLEEMKPREIVLDIGVSVRHLESSMNSVQKRMVPERMKYLTDEEKENLRLRLAALEKRIDEILKEKF